MNKYLLTFSVAALFATGIFAEEGDRYISGGRDKDNNRLPVQIQNMVSGNLNGNFVMDGTMYNTVSGSMNQTVSGSMNQTVSGSMNQTVSGSMNQSVSGEITKLPAPGWIRALNFNPTKAYDPSRVETKLNVNIKEGTQAVRFIRDNSDPYIVTKAYVIKNADPYVLRGVLQTIVTGTLSDSPVAIEAVKYVDGAAVLLIAAEEYRFKDAGNGMSMDQLVSILDKKDLPNSSGTIDKAYFPKYNTARKLLSMLHRCGIGFSGGALNNKSFTTKTIGEYTFKVPDDFLNYALVDEKMNAIIMTAPGFDMAEALRFLKEIDTPAEEIIVNYKVLELSAENDQKLGADFQAWKNNDGINLFSAGGRYNTNWIPPYGLTPNNGYDYAEFFNFNPKWNSKYLDFLSTSGKAKVVSSGALRIANGFSTRLKIADGLFCTKVEPILESYSVLDDMPNSNPKNKGHYQEQYEQLTKELKDYFKNEVPGIISQGNTVSTQTAKGNSFTITFAGDVHPGASNLQVEMKSVSLLGWDSTGKARLSTSKYNTNVQLFNDKKEFVIGGITKKSVVRGVNGLPFLKDIPVLGWLFSTETESIKSSQFVLVATAEFAPVNKGLDKKTATELKEISGKVEKGVKSPVSTLGFQQLLLDTKEIK